MLPVPCTGWAAAAAVAGVCLPSSCYKLCERGGIGSWLHCLCGLPPPCFCLCSRRLLWPGICLSGNNIHGHRQHLTDLADELLLQEQHAAFWQTWYLMRSCCLQLTTSWRRSLPTCDVDLFTAAEALWHTCGLHEA